MQRSLIQFIFILLLVNISISGFSQDDSLKEKKFVILLDSLKRNDIIFDGGKKNPEIHLSAEQAVRYLQQKMRPELWKNTHDPLRLAIGHLVFEASHPPFDSAEYFLNRYPFDSIKVPWDKFYTWEQIKLKIPVIQNPPSTVTRNDSVRIVVPVDSLKNILPEGQGKIPGLSVRSTLKDTTIMILIDTLHKVESDYMAFPFTYYEYPFQGDSIAVAVKSLLDFTASRDSSLLNISGSGTGSTPVWLNSRSGRMQRYWLRNDLNRKPELVYGCTTEYAPYF